MLPQLLMIERTRALGQQDACMVAALQYGSFPQGEGDQFSDIEFAFFWHAYQATWQWGRELSHILAARYALALPTALFDQLTQRFAAARSP